MCLSLFQKNNEEKMQHPSYSLAEFYFIYIMYESNTPKGSENVISALKLARM